MDFEYLQKVIEYLKQVLGPVFYILLPGIVLILCITFAILLLTGIVGDAENITGQGTDKVQNTEVATYTSAIIKKKSDENAISAEIADNSEERAAGLMNRETLDADKGMLFIFPEEQIVSFWMKDTYLPLDMIFMDSEKNIVHIAENAEPLNETKTYSSQKPVKYVLEVNAGISAKNSYAIGDQLEIIFIQ